MFQRRRNVIFQNDGRRKINTCYDWPTPLLDLSPEMKIALVKNDYVELSSFPTSNSGWEDLRTDCGFTNGKRNAVKNLISPLQPQQGNCFDSLISSIAFFSFISS